MEAEQNHCYRHPDRETGLSCSECGRPICYECMTPAPVGLRCPDHSGKPQGIRKVTVAAERAVTGEGSRRPYMLTMTLIGINVTILLVELAIGGTSDGTNNWIFNHGALFSNGAYHAGTVYTFAKGVSVPGVTMVGVSHGEWWRLVTAAFLHFGFVHLGVNMLSLFFTGRILEVVVGRWRFLLIYFVAGIAGSAGALYLSPNDVTAGASGAIFGVLGALFVLERNGTINSGGQIVLWIVLNLALTVGYSGEISVGGHIGGLIAGLVLMTAFVRLRRSMPLSLAAAAAVVAVSLVIAAASV
jgi:membrane associated rhomboid family serine protease